MMKLKFHGSVHDLRALLDAYKITGFWERQPNCVHMLRTSNGANLHWAEGTGRIWFDGNAIAAAQFEAVVAALLFRDVYPGQREVENSEQPRAAPWL